MLEQYKKYSAGESWKIRQKEAEDIVKKIQQKYSNVVVLKQGLLNTIVRVPRRLRVKTLEKEFSCALIPVTYRQG